MQLLDWQSCNLEWFSAARTNWLQLVPLEGLLLCLEELSWAIAASALQISYPSTELIRSWILKCVW